MSIVGFIGLGLMGDPISASLQRGGTELVVFDIDQAAMDRAVGRGAIAAQSARGVADRADIIFACLPSQAVCREVALGEDGVIGGKAVRLYIETSTLGRPLATELSSAFGTHGIAYLDAPVSGGVGPAREGRLTSMVAGPSDAIEEARFLIDRYSSRIFNLGTEAGAAQLAKLINNAIAIFGILVTFEGLAVADRAGLDKGVLTAILNVSTGANFASQTLIPASVLAAEPAPVGKMGVFTKDVDAYLAEIAALGIDPPVARYLGSVAHAAGIKPLVDVVPALRAYFAENLNEGSAMPSIVSPLVPAHTA